MAKKRKIDTRITESGTFKRMSPSAQNLYYHLATCNEVDDDGIVEAYDSVMRSCNATEKDLETLIERRFLLDFRVQEVSIFEKSEPPCVVIKHFMSHNEPDQFDYTPSIWVKTRARLRVKEKSTDDTNVMYSYTDLENESVVLDEFLTRFFTSKSTIRHDEIDQNDDNENESEEKNVVLDELFGTKIDNILLSRKSCSNSLSRNALSIKDKNKEKELYKERFIHFWNAYDHKVGSRAKCEQWFITRKVSDKLLDTMIQAINLDDRLRDEAIIDGKFYPDKPFPQTWLNQKRWESILENTPNGNATPRKELNGSIMPTDTESGSMLPQNDTQGQMDINKMISDYEMEKKNAKNNNDKDN